MLEIVISIAIASILPKSDYNVNMNVYIFGISVKLHSSKGG